MLLNLYNLAYFYLHFDKLLNLSSHSKISYHQLKRHFLYHLLIFLNCHNLRGVEIVHCFDDANYFKNKYPDVSVPKATVPQPEANLTANVPEANLTANVPEANLTANVPETTASLNVPETTATQGESTGKIALNLTVAKDPITRGDSQIVTAVVSDSATGKALDHVFIRLTVKDPIGIIVKNYTATEGNLTRSFTIGENAVGKFRILATASQAGVEIRKSSTFQVQ